MNTQPDTTTLRDSDDYGEYVLTRTVKSARRTYFFDVRATKGDDYFVTITESRKRSRPDGTHYFDRHKIVLYREDFRRFFHGLDSIVSFIKENKPDYFERRDKSAEDDAAFEEFCGERLHADDDSDMFRM